MTTKRFHGKTGEEYDLATIAFPQRKRFHNIIAQVIKKRFSSAHLDTINVLEIGCGTGYTTLIILNADRRIIITAIDNESKMILQAKQRLSQKDNKRIKLIEADALAFLKKQKSDSYDIFASAQTLHNLTKEYRKKLLREIYRVLRPEGLFVNADKYAQDDIPKHKDALHWQLQQFKKEFSKIDRTDLIKEWTDHYADDERPGIIMKESESMTVMRHIGFRDIKMLSRMHMDAVVTAQK